MVRPTVLVLTLFALCVAPVAAWAQVAQHSVYQGRLTDANGTPRAGPVNIELRLYDVATGGAPRYSESHLGVVLDAEGVFSVPLGSGTSASGTYDATLLSGMPRYVEVVVDGELLSPRQRIGSVPTALVAEALVPPANRFEACADGLTVADHQTGLLWERKTGTAGASVLCEVDFTGTGGCPDPHDVNNRYKWSNTGTAPDGGAFTDFLARLNGDPTVVAATTAEARGDPAADPTVCLAHYCDWRLPVITELTTILIGPGAAPGQATTCPSAPCIDPGFAAIGGPTASSLPSWYWSASTSNDSFVGPSGAFVADFDNVSILATLGLKSNDSFVRAVRAGSCN